MESTLFKYSDFFEDDGGFEKVRKEFDALGDDLIKKAKTIREKTKLFDLEDAEAIKNAEEQAENLTVVFKKYGDAKKDLNKIEEEYLKQKKKQISSDEEQIKVLAELDKQLNNHKTDLLELNKLGTKNGQIIDDVNKARVEAQLNIKRVSKAIQEQQKEILKENELSKEEQKLMKAKAVLDQNSIKNINEVRERISALRTVVQTLDFDTQADQIKAFNDEINDLTETLGENSDKFIQNKINIGNYEESIVNALKSSDAFKTGIAGLDSVLQGVLGVFLLTREEIEAMEKASDGNTSAIQRMTIAFGKLNKTLKVSIIGAVLVVLGAVASAFGDTRAGAIRLEKVMKTISTSFIIFGKVASIIVEEIVDSFKNIVEFFKNPFAEQTKKTEKETVSAWDRIKEAFKSGGEAVVEGLDNIDRAFKLEDKIKRLDQEIAKLNGTLAITQSIADDSTRSLSTQLIASKRALALSEQIGSRELEIAKSRLELANEKVKQNIKANAIEVSNIDLALKGEQFAQATLDLAEKRGSALEISNDLIDEQQQAVLDVITAENDLQLTREENYRKRREIERDLFEQNLDLLIDLIDTQKNLSEQFVTDTTKNFENRVNEFNRFLVVFRENAGKELEEFNKLARSSAKIVEEQLLKKNLPKERVAELQKELEKLKGIDLKINFDEKGDFEVFNNGVKLSLDDIVKLNKQLQSLGLAEIPINRFREFNVETTNAVRDFRNLGKEIGLTRIKLNQLIKEFYLSGDELNALDLLQEKIERLSLEEQTAKTTKARKKIIEEIKKLEKEKSDILEGAETQRTQIRIDAINEELKTVEEGSDRYYELLNERLALEKKLREDASNKILENTKTANEKALEDYKKFAEEVKQVLDAVFDKVAEVNQKRIEDAEKQVEKQTELADVQRRRAEEGLTNTLAFEQRELGKREAELIKRQKRQERLEKIRALYTSYNNYSSKGDDNPIVKALRDFAILESISASFKDGGLTGIDGVKTNHHGVTVGKSHNANGVGGNLAWHERGEGFFSRKEVANMGESTFYKIKSMANQGLIDENFFSKQRQEFVTSTNMIITDPGLKNEIKQVKEAIERKPVPNWRMEQMANGMMKMVEETIEKNSVKRNHYKINKPRI